MSRQRAAIVLGASGSVGQALVSALLRDGSFEPVILVSRRPLPGLAERAREAGRTVREQLVPAMNAQALEAVTLEALAAVDGDATGFSVLGVGADTAQLTLAAHRAVDVGLNEAFAKALQASGKVRHLALMSAAGADPNASPSGSGAAGLSRYRRVKGEAEQAVLASGLAVVSIFRPGMIIGSRHTPWLLEKILPLFSVVTPAKYRSVTTAQIASAMVAAANERPQAGAVYHYPDMVSLIDRSSRGESR